MALSRKTPLERIEYALIVSTLLLLVVVTVQPLLNLLAISFSEPAKVPGMNGLTIIPTRCHRDHSTDFMELVGSLRSTTRIPILSGLHKFTCRAPNGSVRQAFKPLATTVTPRPSLVRYSHGLSAAQLLALFAGLRRR